MKLGKYLHYKGKEYEVIGVAHDCESLEELVVYKSLYDAPDFAKGTLWVRKRSDFEAMVKVGGSLVPRFRCLS